MLEAMEIFRLASWLHRRRVPVAPRVCRKAIQVLYGAWIPAEARIGEGTVLGYGGLGVVIHEEARIGRHCFLSPQVTVGGRSGLAGAPVLEDGVVVGTGAKILGPIRVGAGAKVGAGAVVLCDVAAGTTVAGVPARVIRSRGRLLLGGGGSPCA